MRLFKRENPETVRAVMEWLSDPTIGKYERDSAKNWVMYVSIGKDKHKVTPEFITEQREKAHEFQEMLYAMERSHMKEQSAS